MSKTNENPLYFWEKSEKSKSDLERSKETFRTKTHYERFAPIEQTALFANSVLPILSVVTGSIAFYGLFKAMFPSVALLGLLVGCVLLACLEIGKQRLLSIGFVLALKNEKVGAFASLIIGFALIAISATSSIDGAHVAYIEADSTVIDASRDYKVMRDSTLLPYLNAVKSEEKALSDYKASVSWQGKIDVSNKATIATIISREKAISENRIALAAKSIELDGVGKKSIKSAEIDFKKRHSWVLWMVALVECFIVLCSWYLVYYDYRTKQDAELIERNLSKETITLNESDFRQFWQNMVIPNTQLIGSSNGGFPNGSNPPNPNPIGFQLGTSKPEEKPLYNPEKGKKNVQTVSELESYLDKHSDIVDLINEGLPESQIVKQTGKGRSTLYNVKRVINNLQSGVVG
jgi:hypothetical protein